MPYAIEMYFDAETDFRIRALWEEFASIGASFMHDSGARPHVSLAVCESADLPATRQLLDRFAGATSGFPIAFSSLGMFPAAEPVAFLAPKVTSELLALHARFFSEFATVARDCWFHYSPSQWVPHCTLAMGLESHQIGRALDISHAAGLPLLGIVSEIGLVEFRPVRQLYATPFANAWNA
jgi:2'-5' RNA ligase